MSHVCMLEVDSSWRQLLFLHFPQPHKNHNVSLDQVPRNWSKKAQQHCSTHVSNAEVWVNSSTLGVHSHEKPSERAVVVSRGQRAKKWLTDRPSWSRSGRAVCGLHGSSVDLCVGCHGSSGVMCVSCHGKQGPVSIAVYDQTHNILHIPAWGVGESRLQLSGIRETFPSL